MAEQQVQAPPTPAQASEQARKDHIAAVEERRKHAAAEQERRKSSVERVKRLETKLQEVQAELGEARTELENPQLGKAQFVEVMVDSWGAQDLFRKGMLVTPSEAAEAGLDINHALRQGVVRALSFDEQRLQEQRPVESYTEPVDNYGFRDLSPQIAGQVGSGLAPNAAVAEANLKEEEVTRSERVKAAKASAREEKPTVAAE
jgi:hypothetical protein